MTASPSPTDAPEMSSLPSAGEVSCRSLNHVHRQAIAAESGFTQWWEVPRTARATVIVRTAYRIARAQTEWAWLGADSPLNRQPGCLSATWYQCSVNTRSRLIINWDGMFQPPPPRLPAAINYCVGLWTVLPAALQRSVPVTHLSLSRHDPQFHFLLLPTVCACVYNPQVRFHGDRGGARAHRPFFVHLLLVSLPCDYRLGISRRLFA